MNRDAVSEQEVLQRMRNQMTDEQKQLLQMQLNNCCALLNGKLTTLTCVDSRGNVTKKIVIEYND